MRKLHTGKLRNTEEIYNNKRAESRLGDHASALFIYIRFFVSRLSITHILALLSLREERSRLTAAPIKGLGGVVISDYEKRE